VREMEAEKGKFVFVFNHGEKAAGVVFTEELGKSAKSVREIVAGAEGGMLEGKRFVVKTEVPGEAVRIWRVEY